MGYDVTRTERGGPMSNGDRNFATLQTKEIGHELMARVDAYYEYLRAFGRLRTYRRSYDYYYRGWRKGARINRSGDEDQYTILYVNEYRNILQHLVNQTTNQRPAFQPKATNTDYKSQAQVIVANGVLDFYNRFLMLDRIFKTGTEHGLCFGDGYVTVEWDPNAGEDYMPNAQGTGTQKTGELRVKNYTPVDVVFDYTLDSSASRKWYIVRDWVNRYDMMVQYPDLADRIKALSVTADIRNFKLDTQRLDSFSDEIPVWRFYHAKTPSVPGGRFVEMLAPDIVTLDGPLNYKAVPVYRITPDDMIKTVWGYSVAFDLLPLQEALDGLYSIILSNQSTFGVQNIVMPDGANISAATLASGLNLITFDPKFGPPSALNLVSTPKEIFDFIGALTQRMETIAGINSVVRGNPESSLKSGAALALVASQAIQFNSGLQQSYAALLEDVGTAIIDILKVYANAPRMISIAGKSNRPLMSEFKSDDISNISRVTVEMGNPLSRTLAGKVQIADQLIAQGLIKDPEQYIQVATTGKIEPLYENQQAELMLIKAENENLSDGKPQSAMITDNHILHVKEHGVVLASPEARENPGVVQAALAHMQEHIVFMETGNPAILSLNGQPPIPPGSSTIPLTEHPIQPPPLPPVPGGPGGVTPPPIPGGKPPTAGQEGVAPILDATNPVVQKADKVRMPRQPINPLNGERYVPGVPAQ